MELTLEELGLRREKFCAKMGEVYPQWDSAVFVGKVNQYYFTATMQDALLIIRKDGGYSYHVRQSFERAGKESALKNVYPMRSYRDAVESVGAYLGNTYIEMDIATYGAVERLKKYFTVKSINSLDHVIRYIRSVKSPYELYWMKKSGENHDKLLTEIIPHVLREGMTEAEFFGIVYEKMMENGYQGISRFHDFYTEIPFGQIGFGETPLYPSSFDGPSGGLGMSPAVPVGGNPNVRLKKGDSVLVDLAFGMNGYHTDKTQIYMFGAEPSDEIKRIHQNCIDIELKTAKMMTPGAIPSEIYAKILNGLSGEMRINFMGFGAHSPKFIGHGIGLTVDEMPVIAEKFNDPLEENMTLAVEPKKGVKGFGMTGAEDTFVVAKNGGISITGRPRNIIVVK
jgi:Xaa-Pro aminopeptidase